MHHPFVIVSVNNLCVQTGEIPPKLLDYIALFDRCACVKETVELSF